MSKQIGKDLTERLVGAKYLYWKGISTLEENNTFSSGMAVLNFHDATEMILRVIAEYHHVSLKGYTSFPNLIQRVDEKMREIDLPPLTHTTALNQLNKARVNFKHHGLEPQKKDVNKFKNDLEGFFTESIQNYLDLNFNTLSLSDVIKNIRTSNWLNKAEQYLNDSQYYESCACSAIAFEIYRKLVNKSDIWEYRSNRDLKDEIYVRRREGNLNGDISNAVLTLADEVDSRLSEIKKYIEILFDGIDPLKYRMFKMNTPRVAISVARNIISPEFNKDGKLPEGVIERLPKITNEIAIFCYEFALNTILQLQNQNFPPLYESIEYQEINFQTTSDTHIYVSPSEKEIVDTIESGEILKSREGIQPTNSDEYIAILYDDAICYVPRKNLEEYSKG